MMKNYLLYFLIIIVTVACGNEELQNNEPSKVIKDSSSSEVINRVNDPTEIDSLVRDSIFQNDGDVGIIYTKNKIILDNISFPVFPHPAIEGIMAGMKMCQPKGDTTKYENIKMPPCDHSLYRVFKINKDDEWTDGFIVEVKASVYTIGRMVIVVKKVKGKYTAINQFTGKLIELRLDKNNNYQMLIGYADASVGSVAIRHEFDGNKYNPIEVEEINNFYVKEAFKDSLYDVYIKDFMWGI